MARFETLKKYNPDKNVLKAARERISMLFDEFEIINIEIHDWHNLRHFDNAHWSI